MSDFARFDMKNWPSQVEGHRAVDFLEQRSAVSPFDVFHNDAKMCLRLKAAEQTDNEGIVRKGENVSFGKDLVHLIAKDHAAFAHFLHGKTFLTR